MKAIQTISELEQSYDRLHNISELRFPLHDYSIFLKILCEHPSNFYQKSSLLDVGCGQGFFLSEAEKFISECIGVDISELALKKAITRFNKSKLIKGNSENLPFKRDSFDYIVNIGSMEHFLNPEKATKEMARVLKSNGTAMIILPNIFYLGTIWKVFRFGYGEDQGQETVRFFALNEWKNLIEQSGLKIKKIKKYNGFHHIAWFFRRRNPKVIPLSEKILRKIFNLLLKPFIPINLSQCFIFIAQK